MNFHKLLITIVIVLVVLPDSHAQEVRYGVIDFSVSNMRAKPDYESGLDNQLLMGTPVTIDGSDRYWLHVNSPEPYSGWVNGQGVAVMTKEQQQEWIRAPKYIFIGERSYVLEKPEAGAGRISEILAGNIVRICWSDTGRHRPMTRRGWFKVRLPSGREGWLPSRNLADFTTWARNTQFTPETVISYAKRLLGVPYLWGGATVKGTDCSGLVRLSCFMNGVLTRRDASQTIHTGDPVSVEGVVENQDFTRIKKGDLLYFGNKETGSITHVAIYIGDGRIIHSSQVVKINSLDPLQPDYYAGTTRLVGACRLFTDNFEEKGLCRIIDSPFYFAE